MPKSKPKKAAHKKLSPAERLLRSKADNFIEAEKNFWKKRYALSTRLKVILGYSPLFSWNLLSKVP